jgi:hypothetical protein
MALGHKEFNVFFSKFVGCHGGSIAYQ